MKTLRISSDLSLPADAVTSTIVVYGAKGTGKTNLASVLVEEFAAARLRFAVIDPMGVCWGLRYDQSGKGVGIKVLILGGRHGDLPITPESGAIVADLVVDEDANVIVDISRRSDGSMWSIAERVRFVTDYAKRLYQRQGEKRRPIMQVIDEVARFAPQVVRAGDMDVAKCMGAIAVLVEEGRNVGVGVTLVTQRSARLNKDVAELADCMIAFRTLGPNSVRAVLDWLGEHVEKDRLKGIASSLRELPRGSALVVSPGWLEFEGIVAMRMRRTFDSSKTPEAGKQLRVSGTGANPDLEKYRERMAAVVERAKEDDPKELKKQVADLRRELERVGKGQDRAEGNEKANHAENIELRTRVSVLEKQLAAKSSSVLKPSDLSRLEKIVMRAEAVFEKYDAAVSRHHQAYQTALEGFTKTSKAASSAAIAALVDLRAKIKTPVPAPAFPKAALAPAFPKPRPAPIKPIASNGHARTKASASSATNGSATVGVGGLRRMLVALAQCPQGLTKRQIGIRAGLSSKSGTFATYLGRARSEKWIIDRNDIRCITEAGLAALGDFDPLPTGPQLAQYWLGELGNSGAARILRVLVDAYPETLDDATVGVRAGLSSKSGTYATYCGKLRGLELIEGGRGAKRASEELFA